MKRRIIAATGFALVASLLASACGGGSDSEGSGKSGGTIHILTIGEQISHLDPQRNYTGSDLAFATSTMHRTLTSYKYVAGNEGNEITADLATDTGTVSNDGKTWKFTLRDGITFEDGSAITCADVAYGVSRTFATDVITDGPSYAMSYLDVDPEQYPGPYKATAEQQALFDKAITCDGSDITFNLKVPVPDFNATLTLTAFSPVPKAADDGDKYDMHPVSSGPYKIESYEVGKSLVLVRNENWNQDSDPLRKARPDSIVYEFGLDEAAIDERMMADAGDDQYAVSESIQPANLEAIFGDEQYADRRVDYLDPYVSYTNINNETISCVEVRRAIYLALDRDALRKASGGPYAGEYADGFIKPLLAADYAKSTMPEGTNADGKPNVEAAKAAVAAAETACPDVVAHAKDGLNFYYPDTDTWQKALAIWQDNMKSIGFNVKPEAVEASQYWSTVLNPETNYDIARGGWAPDWSNASTIIPELFTTGGGFNLTRNSKDPDYAAFDKMVQEAKVIMDRAEQGKKWQELNQYVVDKLWALPGLYLKAQSIWGSKVGNAYQWAPYGAFNFGDLFAK